jgi:tRNA-splicing ligase RtcB (3'-phosphate/5'-hydroxy nucleic acid ligase)
MLHSGSRNLGATMCDYHHNRAKEMCEKYHSKLPNPECAFFQVDSPEGQAYLDDMAFALAFAHENRTRMMLEFKKAFAEITGSITFEPDLDVHHNYARLENHFGRNVWVHRKGATSARKGELGIIPGSQGSPSYIVKGLGNRDSFMSCSHGAGRPFGRNEACKTLDLEEENKKMEGIVFDSYGVNTIKGKKYPDLQESVGAYKDIDEVMTNQKDLVEIVTSLRPLGSIKAPDRRVKRRDNMSIPKKELGMKQITGD